MPTNSSFNPSLNARLSSDLRRIVVAVGLYVAITAMTVVALAVMAVAAPHFATDHAWGHAVVVCVFAVLLPLRLRAALAGRRGGLRAVGIGCAALLVVNVVEALIPGFFPTWMRLQMTAVAVLMAVIVLLVTRVAVRTTRRGHRGAVDVPHRADRGR